MTIEEEIFKNTKKDLDKISKYGFKKDKDMYKYSKNILDNTFRVDITINNKGIVKGKVYDISFNEEYTNFRLDNNIGSFTSIIKEEFIKILEDIKNKCFTIEPFLYDQANRITKILKDKYNSNPEFEWEKSPLDAVFRNKDSKKWYGIIMNIDKSKLDKKSSGKVEIINVKLDPKEIENLLTKDGFYPAYHMNKTYWITIILDDTITDEIILSLIDKSYSYTILNKKK